MKNNNEKNQKKLSKEEVEYLICQMFKVDLKNKVELNKGGIILTNGQNKIKIALSTVCEN